MIIDSNNLVLPNKCTSNLSATWDKSWIHQYESPWSILMKYCYMNTITFRDLFKIYGNEDVKKINGKIGHNHESILFLTGLNKTTLENVLQFPLHVMNSHLLKAILYPLGPGERLSYQFVNNYLKFCPICFKSKYHSTLQQFSFIHYCPFHREELLTHCPKCYKRFPYNLNSNSMLVKYTCSCGQLLSDDNRFVKSNFSPILAANSDLHKWLNLKPEEITLLKSTQIFDENSLTLDNEDVLFTYVLPFIYKTFNGQNRIYNIGPNHDLLDRRLVKARLSKFDFLKTQRRYEDFFKEEDLNYSYQQAQKIFSSVARHLRKTVLKKHISCIKKYTRFQNELKVDEICPFAIAYVNWRHRLQGFKSTHDVDNWGETQYFSEDCKTYGYPVSTYKFETWLRKLQHEGRVLPKSISLSRNTYMWVVNHLISELIYAEFYRCLEYGLNWKVNHTQHNDINSIYSFKYMPMLVISMYGNMYHFVREEKKAIRELRFKIINTKCKNELSMTKKISSIYIKPNPFKEAIDRLDKRVN